MKRTNPNTAAIAVVAIVFLVACAAIVAIQQFQARPASPLARSWHTAPLLEGQLPIPEEEFKPVLEKAQTELDQRLAAADWRSTWANCVAWAGVVAEIAILIIAALFGRPAATPEAAKQNIDNLSKEQQTPRWLVWLLGILIAVGTVPNILANRLDADQVRFANSAKELNDTIIASTAKLYDPATTKKEARVALAQLRDAIGKK